MSRKNTKKTNEEAIHELIVRYGDIYDYGKVDYQGAHSKITLICKLHGEFSASFTNLISLRAGKYPGCPHCGLIQKGIKRRKSKDEFLTKAVELHGDKYIYKIDTYTTKDKKMEIFCPFHGSFLQSPEKHLIGRGCPTCACNAKVTGEEFFKRAIIKHGDKYDYSFVDSTQIDINGISTEIMICCPVHGVFKQKVVSHLNGIGCRACAKYGFNSGKPAYFYILKSSCENIVKVGITNRDVNTRLKEINKFSPYTFEILDAFKFKHGKNALDLETKILGLFNENMYKVEQTFSGSTECYYVNNYNYLHVILEELNKLEGLYE